MKKRIAFLTDIPDESRLWVVRYDPWIKYLREEGYSVTNWVARGNIIRTLKGLWGTTPDAVLLGRPSPIASLIALAFCVIFQKELIVDCDDMRAELEGVTAHLFEWVIPLFANRIVLRTSAGKERLLGRKIPARKIFFPLGSVDVDPFEWIDAGAGTGARIVLCCGDLDLQKGPPFGLLLDAFSRVVESSPESVLWIIGDGKDAQVLRDYAKDLQIDAQVRWWGYRNPQEISSYLTRADVVVDPVQNTPKDLHRPPERAIEAMYLGTPVVTGDVGNRRELMGGKGIVVPTESAEDWAAAIQKALSMPKRESASRTAKDKFSWKDFVKDFERACLVSR